MSIRKVRVSDIGGSAKNVRNLMFGLDENAYEIDLEAKQIREFARQIAPFTEHARMTGKVKSKPRRPAAERRHAEKVRRWAVGEGLPVQPKGRIANSILERYAEAHED